MKEFVLSFIVLGLVLTGFGHYIRPHLIETKLITKVETKVIEKVVFRKAPLDKDTREALKQYYGMR